MFKKAIFIVLILTFCFSLKGQTLIPYLDNGRYGYSDINGEIVITTKYDRVENFNADGFALTNIGDQIIYIDKTGKEFLSLDNSSKSSFYQVLNSNSEETNRKYLKDTVHDLRLIYFNDKRFHFLNIKTYNITNPYYQELGFQSSAFPNSYYINFKYGYYVGKINENEYEVLNANGEVILKTTTKAIIWNEELISYNDKNGTVLFNPKKNTKISIPYTIVHEIIEDKYLIVSNGNPGKHYFNSSKYYFNLNSPNKRGLINIEGQLIFDTLYNELYKSIDQRLIAKNFYTHLIDYNGNIISQSQYTNISLCENNSFISTLINGKKVLTDSNGKLLINDSYDEIKYHNADKYFTWKKGEYSGIIDSNYQHVVNFKCESIYFSKYNDYFHVSKHNKSGIIDIHQKVIMPIEYDRCYLTHDKFIEIILDGKVGLAKLNGKILFQPIYEEIRIEEVKNQIYFRPKKDNLYACYNEKLKQISGFNSRTYYISDNPIDWYNLGDYYHFTDRYGNPLGYSAKNYHSGYVISDSTFIVVINDDEKVVILINGSSFIEQYSEQVQIDKIQIKSGLIAISKNGLQSVVNHLNKVIIPFDNREILEINDYFIVSKEQDKYYIYNNVGHKIHDDGFDYVSDLSVDGLRKVANIIEGETYEFIIDECFYGKADTIVKNHMNYGYINENGEIVVPLEYNDTYRYNESLTCASKGFKNGEKQSFLLDKLGNKVLTTTYDKLHPFIHTKESSFYVATLKDKSGLIDQKGKVIIPLDYQYIAGFYNLDILRAQDFNDDYHLINMSNKNLYIAKNFENGKISYNCIELPEKRFIVFPEGKSIIIDLDGNVLIEFPEQNVELIKLEKMDLIEVRGDHYKYYINARTLKAYVKR